MKMNKFPVMVSILLLSGLSAQGANAWGWSGLEWSKSDGWKNGGAEFDCTWKANNIWTENGRLVLLAKNDGGYKTCGELRSTRYMRRGRYEVQMSAAGVPGTITSFFTYTGTAGTSSHYEVDIELMGGTNLLHTNVWIGGVQHPMDIDVGQYGLSIWKMERYAFSIDAYGVTWQVFSRDTNEWVTVRRVDRPVTSYMQLFMNNWISANPSFPPSSYNDMPAYGKYDYVGFSPWE